MVWTRRSCFPFPKKLELEIIQWNWFLQELGQREVYFLHNTKSIFGICYYEMYQLFWLQMGSMAISFHGCVPVSENHLLGDKEDSLCSWLAIVRTDCWIRWARKAIQQGIAYVLVFLFHVSSISTACLSASPIKPMLLRTISYIVPPSLNNPTISYSSCKD